MNSPCTIPPFFSHPVIIDSDAAISRMGDKEVYLEIARYFAGHIQDTLATLGRCLESGAMEEATRLAHSLKSNCATVGADGLRDHCLTLEQLCRAGERDAAHTHFITLAPLLLSLQELLLSLS